MLNPHHGPCSRLDIGYVIVNKNKKGSEIIIFKKGYNSHLHETSNLRATHTKKSHKHMYNDSMWLWESIIGQFYLIKEIQEDVPGEVITVLPLKFAAGTWEVFMWSEKLNSFCWVPGHNLEISCPVNHALPAEESSDVLVTRKQRCVLDISCVGKHLWYIMDQETCD